MKVGKHNSQKRDKHNVKIFKGTIRRQSPVVVGVATGEGNRLRKSSEKADRGRNEK